jgi:hypothetical protein
VRGHGRQSPDAEEPSLGFFDAHASLEKPAKLGRRRARRSIQPPGVNLSFLRYLALLALLVSQSALAAMPPEVVRLQRAVELIPGTTEVSVDKFDLSGIPEADFILQPYGDLPLGALRRTHGGLAHELAICVTFRITPDVKGLRALEFVSWWVRDSARGGRPIQIRSLALPPIDAQIGKTLKFSIDFFYSDPKQDMAKLLSEVGELARGLEEAKRLYPKAIAP